MFHAVCHVAERVATTVSRRSFLSQIGQGVLALAGALGIMPLANHAEAAGGGKRCCWYYHARINAYTTQCVNLRDACPGYPVYQEIVQGCRQCRVENI
jgi:hypothetical protein